MIRIGVSLRSGYGPLDARVGARWMVERAAAARAAGLDSLFVGDHHVTGSTYFQNVPILGRLLAEWGDRPAGALFLLPLWHPVLVAEQVATLAALAEGPFVLQLGLGDGDAQFAGMGVPLRGRAAALEGGLDVVRRLLAGEEVTAEDRFGIRGSADRAGAGPARRRVDRRRRRRRDRPRRPPGRGVDRWTVGAARRGPHPGGFVPVTL